MIMRKILPLSVVFISFSALPMFSKIQEIIPAESAKEESLILMEAGHVLFVPYQNKRRLKEYMIKYAKKEFITYEVAPPLKSKSGSPHFVPDSIKFAFDQMNTNWKADAQCHDKAHIWAYEGNKQGIEYKKFFLFFTRKYIKEYRFPWWFHVTPVLVQDKMTFAMDKVFLDAPSSIREWTDIFIENGNACPKIKYYSTYASNKWNKYCYLIETSKYIRQPSQIRKNIKRTHFSKTEVQNAYKRAFYSKDEIQERGP